MAKWIIEMPEGWDCENPCPNCPNNYRIEGQFIYACEVEDNATCPLANAKKAVEVNAEDYCAVFDIHGDTMVSKKDGKPVKLWATENV